MIKYEGIDEATLIHALYHGTVKVFTTLSAQAVTDTKAAPRRAPVADGGGWGDPPSADPYDPNNPDNQLPF